MKRHLPIALALAALTATTQVNAASWIWKYTGDQVAAGGTFTTADQPDSNGRYAILSIAGQRNGIAIKALQPAGTAIPGNAPYKVDNLIVQSGNKRGNQLSKAGFGFALADGTYCNPFGDGGKSTEYLSSRPYKDRAGKETAVSFEARRAP